MSLAASGLLIQWTDPMALGAALVAVVLIGVVGVLLRRGDEAQAAGPSASASTTSPGPTGAGASAGGPGGGGAAQPTPSTPQQLKERAEQSEDPLARGPGESMAEMLEADEIDNTELLSRFVHDAEGSTIGETMTVTEDEVVIKQEDSFLAVDPEQVIEKDGNLRLDPNVDWERAEERGENWRKANFDRMEYDEEGLPEDG